MPKVAGQLERPQGQGLLFYTILLFKESANEQLTEEDEISFYQDGAGALHLDFWFRESGVLAPQLPRPVQRPLGLASALAKVTPHLAPERCSVPGLPEEYLGCLRVLRVPLLLSLCLCPSQCCETRVLPPSKKTGGEGEPA